MNTGTLKLDELFDAEEYRSTGSTPWTFFAYPTSLAVQHGLPPDSDTCRLLGEVQQRGIDVAIWINGIAEDTSYFACRKEDSQRLHVVLAELEYNGDIEAHFLEKTI